MFGQGISHFKSIVRAFYFITDIVGFKDERENDYSPNTFLRVFEVFSCQGNTKAVLNTLETKETDK